MRMRRTTIWSRLAAENVSRLGQQSILPVGDRVGMHVMLLRQLGRRFAAWNGSQCYLGLECR